MQKPGRANFRVLQPLGVAGFLLALVASAMAVAGIRINTSYSLPLGLYIATSDPTANLIEFCPVGVYAVESGVRGYRTRGTACPDGAVPLLKPIVALPGDEVAVTADGITVNGRRLPKTAALSRDAAGRSLTRWPNGVYDVRPGSVWVASTYNRGSYDSRYMGPIPVSQIRARLRPLWVL